MPCIAEAKKVLGAPPGTYSLPVRMTLASHCSYDGAGAASRKVYESL